MSVPRHPQTRNDPQAYWTVEVDGFQIAAYDNEGDAQAVYRALIANTIGVVHVIVRYYPEEEQS